MLYKNFHAREKIRKNSYLQGRKLNQKQTGYSCKKKRLHEYQLTEDQSQWQQMEQLAAVAEDDDRYDSDADEESDKLEQSLEREKASQVRRKKERWQAMEARDQRTVVSQKE